MRKTFKSHAHTFLKNGEKHAHSLNMYVFATFSHGQIVSITKKIEYFTKRASAFHSGVFKGLFSASASHLGSWVLVSSNKNIEFSGIVYGRKRLVSLLSKEGLSKGVARKSGIPVVAMIS